VCFLKGKKREKGREKKKKKKGQGTALVSPLKQILVILALVICKVLETSPCN
jgi:multisubunit Na+/H+ antiporter MnhC subunit